MSKKVNNTPVSHQAFISALESGKKCYAKKDKSWQKIFFWFENFDHENRNWFLNIGEEKRSKEEGTHIPDTYWITAAQLPGWLTWWDGLGYKFYIA